MTPKLSLDQAARVLVNMGPADGRCVFLQSLETLDNGKPFNDAYGFDIPFSAKCFRYYAGWADKVTGQTIPVGECVSVCASLSC